MLPRDWDSSTSVRSLSLRGLSLRGLSLRGLSLRGLSLRGLSLRGALILLACTLSIAACGPSAQPKRPDYVDQMVFAPPTPDLPETGGGGVDSDAVEPPTRRGTYQRPTTRTTKPPARRSAATKATHAARCGGTRAGPTRSVGAATRGHLVHGCLLPRRGAGYVRRNRAGWGTEELVGLVQWATSAVSSLYRGSVPVVVGALSAVNGGRLRGHRSHQSGRDIDIGFFASDNRSLPHFRRMNASNLDVVKSWSLIGALLSSGRVQYIFMDYELQVLFHRHLEGEGVPASTLKRVFQFPAGRRARRGIIRHAKGHADHIHVRLRCPAHAGCR